MGARAVIRLNFLSEKQLSVMLKVLEPEIRGPLTRRSRVSLRCEGATLALRFEARDTSALRAAINSYLRWIYLTMDVLASVNSLETSFNKAL